jgi:glycosyltransferase involved in cell wall biosynthesis
MKVLHVVNSLEPGGLENGVVNLALGLAPEIVTSIACLRNRGAFASRLPKRVEVRVLGKRNGFSLGAMLRLALAIQTIRPDCIHTHNLGPLIYSSMATLMGRLCPIVHGEHSLLAGEELNGRRIAQRRRLISRCRAVHTVAPLVTEQLKSLGLDHPQLQTIPNGVDTDRFTPGSKTEARRHLGLPDNEFLIGLVGRFGVYKGHATMLEAFQSLGVSYPSAHLVFAGGGGPQEEKIRHLVHQSSFHSRIHLTGFLSDPVPVYQALDLLVVPSTNEGMSNAVLEAMSCGLPVIANAGCGNEAIIEDGQNGVVSDLGTPSEIARFVALQMDDPARLQRLGSLARAKIVEHYSIRKMLDSYRQLYGRVDAAMGRQTPSDALGTTA